MNREMLTGEEARPALLSFTETIIRAVTNPQACGKHPQGCPLVATVGWLIEGAFNDLSAALHAREALPDEDLERLNHRATAAHLMASTLTYLAQRPNTMWDDEELLRGQFAEAMRHVAHSCTVHASRRTEEETTDAT